MANYLAENLRALRVRTGHDPVLGRRDATPIVAAAEDLASARARLDGIEHGRLPSTIFLVGAGRGAMIEAIAERFSNVEIVVFEPDPAAASRLLEARDWTPLITANRLAVFVGPDFLGASGFWRPVQLTSAPLPLLVDPALADARPDDARRTESMVERLVEEGRANAEARRAQAGRYLLQTLANASAIAREGDAAALTHAFAGLPAVIVGAGPSLDGRLPELAAIADRAVIIACAAAARPLVAAQIAPHLIVSVDPTEASAMHLLGLPSRRSWLVGEGSLHPSAFTAFDRRVFTFNLSDHHPWPWLRSFGLERGRIQTWGSSATSALDLALKMGCSPILFAGLDFAFTGGRPYCRGTTFEPLWAVQMGAGQTLDEICRASINRWPAALEPDAEGHQQRTAPHLVSFRNWMRQQIEAASHIRFMHVTPGGILHHRFIEHCTAEEAIGHAPRLERQDLEAQLRALHRNDAESERLFDAIEQLLDEAAAPPASSPIAAWSAFAGRVLRPDMLHAALRSHEYNAWCRGRRRALPSASPVLLPR